MEEGYYYLISFACHLGLVECSEYSCCEVHGYLMVAESLNGQHRCACLVSQRSEDAASCIECGKVESRKVLVRTLLAVS